MISPELFNCQVSLPLSALIDPELDCCDLKVLSAMISLQTEPGVFVGNSKILSDSFNIPRRDVVKSFANLKREGYIEFQGKSGINHIYAVFAQISNNEQDNVEVINDTYKETCNKWGVKNAENGKNSFIKTKSYIAQRAHVHAHTHAQLKYNIIISFKEFHNTSYYLFFKIKRFFKNQGLEGNSEMFGGVESEEKANHLMKRENLLTNTKSCSEKQTLSKSRENKENKINLKTKKSCSEQDTLSKQKKTKDKKIITKESCSKQQSLPKSQETKENKFKTKTNSCSTTDKNFASKNPKTKDKKSFNKKQDVFCKTEQSQPKLKTTSKKTTNKTKLCPSKLRERLAPQIVKIEQEIKLERKKRRELLRNIPLSEPTKVPRKPRPEEKSTRKTTQVINNYLNRPFAVKHRTDPENKTYKRCVYLIKKLMDGTLFPDKGKFTVEQIYTLFDRYEKVAFDNTVAPAPGSYKDSLKKKSLVDLIYNPNCKTTSLLMKFCLDDTKYNTKVKILNQDLFEQVMQSYKTLMGINGNSVFSNSDISAFAQICNEIIRVKKDNGIKQSEERICELLFEELKSQKDKGGYINIHFVKQPSTFYALIPFLTRKDEEISPCYTDNQIEWIRFKAEQMLA